MLDKLTDEQIKLMDNVKNEYVHLLNRRSNDKDIIEGVKFVYKISGLREPDIQIFDSPFACQLYLNAQQKIQRQVMPRVEQQIRQQVWQQALWLQQTESQTWKKVDQQVKQQVRRVTLQVLQPVFLQVDQKARQQIEQQVGQHGAIYYYPININGTWICDWLSSCDYFERIGIIKNGSLDQYKKYIKSGVFLSIYLDGLAIVSRNPLRLSKDDRERLHCLEGYAIEWADGYGQNYVHGVFFELDLFDKIFIKKNVTGEDILNLRNVEQKAVAIQFFGYDKLIDQLMAIKIDSYKVKNEYTGIESISELYDFEIENKEGDWRRSIIRGRFVKVQDHSTGKITVLGVPISKETESVKGAIAWTFNLKKDEYSLIIET